LRLFDHRLLTSIERLRNIRWRIYKAWSRNWVWLYTPPQGAAALTGVLGLLPHDCCQDYSKQYPEWEYRLANGTEEKKVHSIRSIKFKSLAVVSDSQCCYVFYSFYTAKIILGALFGLRKGPQIAELDNAIDNESQAQESEQISRV
jgi:hypothetical protein